MLNVKHILLTAALCLSASVFASPASAAQPDHDARYEPVPHIQQNYVPQTRRQNRSRVNQWAQRKISAAEAKSIARRKVPNAQVVDIFLNGNTYTVRMLRKDGHRVDVLIDAVSGRVRR